jgi:chemotaxis protein methyltransferase CheR
VKARTEPDDGLVQQLSTLAASWSGFTRDAVHVDAIRRAARECLDRPMTSQQLLERASAGDPHIVRVFREAICVGETYFFRSPEHFAFLMDQVLRPQIAAEPESLRAWSAACSTGEEAHSIAACLLAAAPPSTGIRLEVLGTDLRPDSIRRARQGEYRAWSVRETAPIPVPLFHPIGDGRVRVNDDVRAITTFQTHDLLDPPPPAFGEFNVIFCRNVLVYFDPEAIRQATKYLASRLALGGVIVFGVLEVNDPPPGLVAIGGPGLTAFSRPLPGAVKTPTRRPKAAHPFSRPPAAKAMKKVSLKPGPRRSIAPKRRASLAPGIKPPPADVLARHVEALHLIEREQKREALSVFSQIEHRAPGYVAALLDQALLSQKSGHKKLATELMQKILRFTEGFTVETLLPGPEELPVSYYRSAAERFLHTVRKDR